MMPRTAWIAAAVLAAAAAAAGALALMDWRRSARAEEGLRQRVSQRVTAPAQTEVACTALARRQPLVLLALGQSNAGNHGSAAPGRHEAVFVVTDQGRCHHPVPPLAPPNSPARP